VNNVIAQIMAVGACLWFANWPRDRSPVDSFYHWLHAMYQCLM